MTKNPLNGFKADFSKVQASIVHHSENRILFQDEYTTVSIDKNGENLFITTTRPGRIGESYFTIDGKFKSSKKPLHGVISVSKLKHWKRRRKAARIKRKKTSKVLVSHMVTFDDDQVFVIKLIHQKAGLTKVYAYVSEVSFSVQGNLENIFHLEQQALYAEFLLHFHLEIPEILMGDREDSDNYTEGWSEADLQKFITTSFDFQSEY